VQAPQDGALSVEFKAITRNSTVYYNADQAQTATGDLALTVRDTRGTGAGWNVKISTTGVFTDSGRNLTFTSPTWSLTAGNDAVDQNTNATKLGVTESAADNLVGSGARVLSASKGNGMGVTDYTGATMSITVPAGTLVGNYHSTLNVVIATDPQ